MVVLMVGFGYAKPVPTDPRNFQVLPVSDLYGCRLPGPCMNLLLALSTWNLYLLLRALKRLGKRSVR